MTVDKKTGVTILILENVKIQGKKHQLRQQVSLY